VDNKLKEEYVRKELKSMYFIKSCGFVEYSSNLTKKVRSNFELIYVGSNRINSMVRSEPYCPST
jgi:hypothetical protein